MLQAICKTCSRVLLSPVEKERFLRALHAIKDPQRQRAQRTSLHERVVLPAVKKCRVCHYCGAQNGVVKKLSTAFRIIHELRHKEALPVKQAYLDSFSTAAAPQPAAEGAPAPCHVRPIATDRLLPVRQDSAHRLSAAQLRPCEGRACRHADHVAGGAASVHTAERDGGGERVE